ncbi:hypothetical protein C5167_012504 [Papaver somniferum]|uniref:Uncharacterized protein n=1 Tax=Papaver somniferum TaxID=3469 RepID=A0A4Y7IXN6_PAPSO|nr:hypothetical protein C5167_012504 [Papaver somniferum]
MKEEALRAGFTVPITSVLIELVQLPVKDIAKEVQHLSREMQLRKTYTEIQNKDIYVWFSSVLCESEGTASFPLIAWDEEQAEALGALQEIIWAKERILDICSWRVITASFCFCVCGEF